MSSSIWSLALSLGADISASPHGLLTVEARRQDLTLGLYTDTVQLRWDPELDRGRAWLAVRGEAAVAGMFPSQWVDGAPVQGGFASYAGVEGGALRYLRGGLYVGGEAQARYWVLEDLDDRPVLLGDALFGYWSEELHAEVRAGTHYNGGEIAPHLQGQLKTRSAAVIGPRLEIRAGVADNQDDVLKTRIGGLNPYVVPLGGAGWAEWWAEDYVGTRAGMGWRNEQAELALLADLVAFDGRTATGLALDGGFHRQRWFVDAAVGWSPWIERADGVSRWTGWLVVGRGHR